MGIQGLLPLLKSIHKPTHLRNFAGQTLGVDAYGWLHRGTVSCAIELAEQKPTRKHIDFALSRVRMLLHFGVKPYLVFDGDYLPSKEHTEKERAARRKESKRKGLEMLSMKRVSQAYLELQKAVDVTPSMARELIEELKQLNVPYVVAPYEADAQLAYLEKQGHISGVLSEDSDLLVFGVKCLLTKLDQYGECVMVNRADFTACREISLVGWSDKEFRMMTMLSGCDYLPGIDKMGLKTAYRLVRKHKVLNQVIRSVQFDGKMKVPPKYLEAFLQAENTFLYQWVYCPEAQCLVNLNTIPAGLDVQAMPYIGKHVEPDLATGVADGDLDPNTKQPLQYNKHVRQAYTRQQIVQTPNEKPGKPITEFFKAKRTPLAELDPNSFTPSPSQQRLLENQRSLSWSASQAQVARPPALDRVAAANRRASAPQDLARGPMSLGQRVSPKRRRLCSDSMLADSMGGDTGLDYGASRFFSKRNSIGSPSLRKTSRKDQFELWSDKVAADDEPANADTEAGPAAAKLPPLPKKRKKVQVFADPEPFSQQFGAEDTSQSTLATTLSTQSQTLSVSTAATSFDEEASSAESTVFSQGVNANFAAFKSKFVFKSEAARGSNISRDLALPRPSSLPRPKRRNEKLSQPTDRIRHPNARKNVDDAQPETHLGSEDDIDTIIPGSSPPRGPQSPLLGRKDDMARHADAIAVNGDLETSPPHLGSEDLLIPNSPESVADEDRARRKVDFGRFAFAG